MSGVCSWNCQCERHKKLFSHFFNVLYGNSAHSDVVLYKFELWSCCFLCRTRRELAGARRELEAANASKKEKGGTKVKTSQK